MLCGAFGATIDEAARRLDPPGGILLAVSGGPDSLALLLASAAWRRSAGSFHLPIHVATVDHRLRPESAGEARFVAALSAQHGFPHATLPWAGPDGRGNLSARAREARYGLLLSHARQHDLGLVLVAHHRDDDVETHLIRRSNGADLVVAAGMRRLRWLAPDVLLGRPFLGIARVRLARAVAAEGMTPVDDPANRDPRYQRARIRIALTAEPRRGERALRDLARCKMARDRGEQVLADAIADLEGTGRLRFAEDGAIVVERSVFAEMSERCAGHLVSRAVVAAAGTATPPSGEAVREVLARLRSGGAEQGVHSLGGALVAITSTQAVFMREYGRSGIAALSLAEATRKRGEHGMTWPAVFDGRVVLDLGPWRTLTGPKLVPLGALGLGGHRTRCLPVLLDAAGRPHAAMGAAAIRLGRDVAALDFKLLAPHLLKRDLPPPKCLTPPQP
ncbi:tRNA lysidine(34) synthetase TilS [Aurantimonas sp. 22II-16-19i]|uniref:tRNA lysidine(34) synthetase TilS n=1 Tax=Aurantimonas sp. 22II-16-19i TaxID=1317114 RepID=UPI0009F7B03D|nr:tRNA lysidine(34) synthetase TilS [Aurantimonas sp. 22II-16-19i]ORE91146.1 tRNA(Ile)-lysidine synthase [Aurantimonas sp. 22II-16-19i]